MDSTPPVELGKNEQVVLQRNCPDGAQCAEALDPRLDFLSDEFDAAEVLRCSPNKVHLPHPTILPCDNLQAYLSVVQGVSRNPYFLADTSKVADGPHGSKPENEHVGMADEEHVGVADRENVGVADTGMAANDDSKSSKGHIKTVIDFMEHHSCTGPFSVLQRSWVEGRRVKVLTRHCAGVRGVCIGHLIAFDHHMNLVLGDVEEWWAPFKTVFNGGITLSKNQRRRRSKLRATTEDEERVLAVGDGRGCGEGSKWERYQVVKQLFMRGDNIILVSTVTS